MVLGDDADIGEVVICSGWGPHVDWLENLRAGPAREIRIGRDRFVPQHRFLTDGEAFATATAFRDRHPHRLRLSPRSSDGATYEAMTPSARSSTGTRSWLSGLYLVQTGPK